jgi:uncharacterized repeat protein (TIGR03943 family)
MTDPKRTSLRTRGNEAHVLGMLSLLMWLALLGWLLIQGRYTLYLMPQFRPLLIIGLAILGISLLAKIVLRQSHSHARNRIDLWVRLGILLLPILFLAFSHGESLGAFAFDKRRVMGLTPGVGHGIGPEQERPSDSRRPPSGDAQDGKIYETDLLSLHWNHVQFLDTRVKIIGRVARDDRLPAQRFILFRFVVLCCVADAQPLALLVDYHDQELPPEDCWVEVRGFVETGEVDGRTCLILRCDDLHPTDPPQEHYLFAF